MIDYVTNDEALLIAFSTDRAFDPAEIGRAREQLANERAQSP